MLAILTITLPIYLAIAVGFLTTRLGLFARADMRVFGKFVINLALPAMLFNALSQRCIGDILNLSYLLAYLVGSLAVLALFYGGARRLGRLGSLQSCFVAMGSSCSNSGFVGYPILLLTMAPVAGVALALNMLVENLVVIPLALMLAERSKGSAGSWQGMLLQTFKRLAVNPMVLALLAGFIASLLGWRLPLPVDRAVNLFAQASGGLSLFVIGGTLTGLPLRGMLGRITPIIVGKLIAHPLAVAAALALLPLLGLHAVDEPLRSAAVLMAAMPMMGIYPLLAQAYGEEDVSAAALLGATVSSFATVSALLWVLHV